MSIDEQDDDITMVTPHHGEYAASEPGASPHRIKTGNTRLSEAEILCHDAIEHYNVGPHDIFENPSTTEKTYLQEVFILKLTR